MALHQVGARMEGDVYQGLFFWLKAAELLRPASMVERVVLEHDEARGVDDVAVFYREPGVNEGRCMVRADYFQVKYHVNNRDTYSSDALIDPTFIKAKSSLLQHFHSAYAKLATKNHHFRLYLVSNWRWKDDDKLAKLIREDTGELPASFFDAGPRSDLGTIRETWRRHLRLDEDTFMAFAKTLRFKLNHFGRQDFKQLVNTTLESVGLKVQSADQASCPYESLTQQFLMNKCNSFDEASFRKLCEGEGLLTRSSSGGPQLPAPPTFYAVTDYIGRTTFIGRKAQLQLLSAWAQASDKTSILLFEAIGGSGKSMLTWEWATKYASSVRSDWAGRFWYSFYEKGAVMRRFCQHALAYMTQQPLREFDKKTMFEMRRELLHELHKKPWLLILDGLERVLVAYHRIDAAEVSDEYMVTPVDKILDRAPRDAIHHEDADLLRSLAVASPSKILISTRLIPSVLLNEADLPIPGLFPIQKLSGLEDEDAEALFRSCHVRGTSADIRYYLKRYCDNHPLVILVLAGLINSPSKHRGDFDAWAADPGYGAKLNLASLTLIQSRNHILRAAMDALEPASYQLLSTIALLSSGVDYETVAAFNPHLPPEPEKVLLPTKPENKKWHFINNQPQKWGELSEDDKSYLCNRYEDKLANYNSYKLALHQWRESEAVREAPRKLELMIANLEQCGLLQYDPKEKRYDLHPVVRGVAAGSLKVDDKERYGKKVVDYFNARPRSPYENAKEIEDLESGLQVVRTLLKLGHHQQAANAYWGNLSHALTFNLESHEENLSLLRPFFLDGWGKLPTTINPDDASYFTNSAAISLASLGEDELAVDCFSSAMLDALRREDWINALIRLGNISLCLASGNQLARSRRVLAIGSDLANASEDEDCMFTYRLNLFTIQARLGEWPEAESTWLLLDSMGRKWSRALYLQGRAEMSYARYQFWQGRLHEEHLVAAATLAEQDHNRATLRETFELRGTWLLEQGEWEQAAASFTTAVAMARQVRIVDETSETGLALAQFNLLELNKQEARFEAERLANLPNPDHRTLARLWRLLGDIDKAKPSALAAFTWAWADGEPYVHRYELIQATKLLNELGEPTPSFRPYDSAKEESFEWEQQVRSGIQKLCASKEDMETSGRQVPD